jgi:anti-anti-sigma factor
MNISVQKQQGIINIQGRFDFIVHREFKKCYTDMLDNPEVREIEINMRDTRFIDSAALGMLMLLRERAHAVDKSVVLSNPSGTVFTLLEVANFDRIFLIKGLTSQSGR